MNVHECDISFRVKFQKKLLIVIVVINTILIIIIIIITPFIIVITFILSLEGSNSNKQIMRIILSRGSLRWSFMCHNCFQSPFTPLLRPQRLCLCNPFVGCTRTWKHFIK